MTIDLASVSATERVWGTGEFSPLYCPGPSRLDDDLASEVNDRLVAWAEEVGIYSDQLDRFRDIGFGRLAMLTYTDCEDPDLLLLAAQLNAAWWASDDYYADEGRLGAVPAELAGRLALVMSAMDPPAPAGGYTRELNRALAADPVLVALRSATEHLRHHVTPAQVARVFNTTCQMYVSWNAYVGWRQNLVTPPVWRYLAARQHDSFYTSMTLIDIVGGYELPADLYYEPSVHRALMQAGTAAVIVNDLHSIAHEAAEEPPDCNLALLIAAEQNYSLPEAIEATVRLHNDFVRGFEESCRSLAEAMTRSAELRRFLSATWAWLGGCLEWHATSPRYQT